MNVAGSLLLGYLIGKPVAPWLSALLGTGFCGALTTYSTFALEAVELGRSRARATAARYVAVTLVAGIAAAVLGVAIGRAL